MMHRRIFLRNGALAVGLSAVPGFLTRTLLAAEPTDSRKVLVVLFLRGAADGLNMVVPFGEKAYYQHRPTIGIPAPGEEPGAALDLDGFFGLHPALRPLLSPYEAGRLGIINAVGTPDTGGRSHFQAQDFMESAVPGDKTVSTGWLNRYLQAAPEAEHVPLRATAIGETLPKALRGPASALAVGSVDGFGLEAAGLFESLYSEETNSLLTGTAKETFETIRQLQAVRAEGYLPARGANYGNQNPNSVGGALMQVAMLIKANLGMQIAFVDVRGGWDTHSNEPERLPGLLRSLGQALAGFDQDLGDRMEDVVVLTMSEFGRTARENGNRGTDHGHANLMFAMGGPVKGGKTYGTWPGLAAEQLNEDRDLTLTTDFRDVLAEVLVRHLKCETPGAVFPGFTVDPARFTGFI